MASAVFSMVPVEVWADKRLTLEQLRVLGALLSFCGPDRRCFPSRDEISARSGVHVANVSAATTALERLGWVTKAGKGGFSKANHYTIHVPETLAQQATVAESATVAQQARGMRVADQATVAQQATVAESASSTLAQQARGKEQTSEQTSSTPADAGVATCPVDEIIDLYHCLLPNNPRSKVSGKARTAAIKARWKEAAKLTCKPFGYSSRSEGLNAWRQFFEVCAESDFLTGKVPGTNGRPPFVADIDFLMSPSGFVRTLENKYHRDADTGMSSPVAPRTHSTDSIFRGAI